MKILILLTLFTMSLAAPPFPAIVLFTSQTINPFESIWKATCKTESNFDSLAIGDKHLKYKSYGIAQIQNSRRIDFNRRTGNNYTLIDMYSPEKSKVIFMYYATEIGPYNFERISREWNGGSKGMSKKSTLPYWNKIKKAL